MPRPFVRPTRSEAAVLGAGPVGIVLLVTLRLRARGVSVADDPATHWLGEARAPGSGLIWRASSLVTRSYVPFVIVALVVLLGCLARPSTRRAACAGLVVLGASSAVTQALKMGLRPLLGAPAATLPSGHATLVVAACVGLVAVVPTRHRLVGTCVLAFVATAGALGVVVAQWHRPGDAFAALAVVAVVTVTTALVAPWRAPIDDEQQPSGRFGHGAGTDVFVAAVVGAATCVVTFQGWGSGLTGHTVGPVVGGLVTRWGLALGVACLVCSAARVGRGSPRDLH